MLEVKEVQTLSEQEKTVSLFEFIKELNKLKQKVVLNIRKKVKQRMIYCFPSENLNLKNVRFQMNFLRTGWYLAGTIIIQKQM